jgi:hypothetical protein
MERINGQDTTPEDLRKIKELEEILKQDGTSFMPMNNHHHASVQCNSNHAADSCPPMSRDASTQKSFTTLTPMQLENVYKQESVKQSPLAKYKVFRLHTVNSLFYINTIILLQISSIFCYFKLF